jgi:nitrogen fixation NifU-like protein|tara:strand:- start:722 stop:1120 length:399 start_codon:yes stop_codon:yes gene_type:complete
MDLRILEIASNTENHKVVKNYTHQSKNKNLLCGDEMEISLIVKDNTIEDMGYQCRSCVYCQASVSLLSQKIKNTQLSEIKSFINLTENLFNNADVKIENKWQDFKEIMNRDNISRKECLLLPFKTIAKALKI